MSDASSELQSLGARMRANRGARWSLVVILLLVLAAALGPLLQPHSAHEQLGIIDFKNLPPSWKLPFGTDQYSRSVLARVLEGGRISLSVAILSVLISMTVGAAYGLVAGYAGGRIDTAMMRILDACLSIPRVLLLIATLTLWYPIGLPGLILLIGATGWFGLSRIVRAATLAAREETYVEAARALGAPASRIVLRHLLPNIAAPIIVTATLGVGNIIALEAGLSFLGVGAREPKASWGSLFLDGVTNYADNWWVMLFPGIAIVVTALAFNALGDALRDVLDPRQLHERQTAGASFATIQTRMIPPENG